MTIIRRIGFALLACAAVLVWAFMGPERITAEDHADRLGEIAADDDANNEFTEGAPQQEVVNGWTSINYLELIAEDVNQLPDNRPAALLTLLVLAACLHYGTTPTSPVVLQRVPVNRPGPTPGPVAETQDAPASAVVGSGGEPRTTT
jgi:hypothetical protein